MKLIRIIIMKGRQAGYFIILACQRPDAKIPEMVSAISSVSVLRWVVCLQVAAHHDVWQRLTNNFKEKDIAGRGYVNTGNGVEQSFTLHEDPI